jgi:hypothetical protein
VTDNAASISDKVTQKARKLPKFVHDFTSFDRAIRGIPQNIVKLAVEASSEKVTNRMFKKSVSSHKGNYQRSNLVQQG